MQPAGAGCHDRHISGPDAIGLQDREVLLQKIGRRRSQLVMFRHDAEAAFAKRFYAVLTAQSGNAVTAADDALPLQYLPRLVGAVCLARLQMQGSDLPQQFSVFYSVTALGPAQPVVKAAAGHAQGPARPPNILNAPSVSPPVTTILMSSGKNSCTFSSGLALSRLAKARRRRPQADVLASGSTDHPSSRVPRA